MLEARGLTIHYDKRAVLSDVSFAAPPGMITAVVGPNGAGKSTLLKGLCGDLPTSSGTVLLDGAPIAALSPRALAERRAVLPQNSRLAFPFTVHEVVRLGRTALARQSPARTEAAAVAEALASVDLAGFGPRFYQELSGGEQQRVQLARIIFQVPPPTDGGGPRYWLLDEPTASLDLKHQLVILDLARAFAAAGGGVLAILHDLNLAAMYADQLAIVSEGRLAAIGHPTTVLREEVLGATFGVSPKVRGVPPPPMPFVLPQTIKAPHQHQALPAVCAEPR